MFVLRVTTNGLSPPPFEPRRILESFVVLVKALCGETFTYPPRAPTQFVDILLTDVFSAVGAQQQALAYASVVDNNTSDPTTIPVQLE